MLPWSQGVTSGLPTWTVNFVCLQYDQDIVDLLTSLKPGSVTDEGGMYAAAMPPPPLEAKTEADGSLFSLRGPAAEKAQVLGMIALQFHKLCTSMCKM